MSLCKTICSIDEMKENVPPEIQNALHVKCVQETRKNFVTCESITPTDKIYQEMGVQPISETSAYSGCIPPSMFIYQQHGPYTKPLAMKNQPCYTPITDSTKKSEDLKGHLDEQDVCSFVKRRKTPSNNTNEDYFHKLSDEIILYIMRWIPKFFLARCATVCKRWNRLIEDESLWRRIDLSNRQLKSGDLGRVITRGVYILRLSKSEIETPLFTGNLAEKITNRMVRVQYLDLGMATINTFGLEQVLSVCVDLRKLSLENCKLNTDICGKIGSNRKLEALNLSMCDGITIDGMIAILSNCRRLSSLNLAWTKLNPQTVMYTTSCLPPSLIKLNISGLRENLTDEDILKLTDICPDLTELDISDSTVITGTSISIIAEKLVKLEYLAVSRCYLIRPSYLPHLLHLNSLLALDMFGMLTDDGMAQLSSAMSRVSINKFPFSSIARPTTGIRRTSIWGLRVRDLIT